MDTHKARLAVVLALVLACIRLGFAASGDVGLPNGQQVTAVGYNIDTTSAACRPGLAVVDTLTTAGILAVQDYVVNGRQTISIEGRASSSGATIGVQVVKIYKSKTTGTSTIVGYSPIFTLSAGTVLYEGTYYVAPGIPVDTSGATNIRVIVLVAPSAGTFDLWVPSF